MFLLRLAELTADGENGLRELISEQLAFARTHVVELPPIVNLGLPRHEEIASPVRATAA
jgi:hypothetical protein